LVACGEHKTLSGDYFRTWVLIVLILVVRLVSRGKDLVLKNVHGSWGS